MTLLNTCAILKRSWCLDSNVEFVKKQQKLLRLAIIKQGYFEFIEVRLLWCRIRTQFNLNKIFIQSVTVPNFCQCNQGLMHVNFYCPCIPLLIRLLILLALCSLMHQLTTWKHDGKNVVTKWIIIRYIVDFRVNKWVARCRFLCPPNVSPITSG